MATVQSNVQTTPTTSDPKPKYKGKSGGQIFHEMLIGPHKVEVMFGYPGGAILPVFDQLYKTPAKFILNRHEQGSPATAPTATPAPPASPASASSPPAPARPTPSPPWPPPSSIPSPSSSSAARSPPNSSATTPSRKPTSPASPAPAPSGTIWSRTSTNSPASSTKHSWSPPPAAPAPCSIDLPKDVTTNICTREVDDTPRPHIQKRKTTYMAAHARQVQEAAELINRSEKPILYVGGGAIISGASAVIRKLAEKGNIPCTTTLLGLGAFDEHDPRACSCSACTARPPPTTPSRIAIASSASALVSTIASPAISPPSPPRQDHPHRHRSQQHQQNRRCGCPRRRRRQNIPGSDAPPHRAPRPHTHGGPRSTPGSRDIPSTISTTPRSPSRST